MLTLLFLIGIIGISAENCDEKGILVYEDMACKPKYDQSKSCPSSFECNGITKTPGNCIFRNHRYNQNQRINSNDTFCAIGCSCNERSEGMSFNCAILECGNFGPIQPGCYFTYNLEKCCGGSYCPPPNENYRCKYDGVEYRLGERFFPKESCHMCLCQNGWNGKVETPFCKRRQCEVQVTQQAKIQNGCSPLYELNNDETILCCPKNWICPEGKETITGTVESQEICKFGAQELKVGQGFQKVWKDRFTTKEIKCQCEIPPLLTCTIIKN